MVVSKRLTRNRTSLLPVIRIHALHMRERVMCQGLLTCSLPNASCEHSDHRIVPLVKKKHEAEKKEDDDAGKAAETLEALNDWQNVGGPVVGVEPSS